MADSSQFGTPQDDDLDFRPVTQAKPGGVSPADDGIDFQSAAAKPRNVSKSQSSDEIDFQAANKPTTFDSLYREPPRGASLSDQAARVGGLSLANSLVGSKGFDLTSIPRSPFTNQLEPSPPMATEEETRRYGTIGPRDVSVGERVKSAILPGLNPHPTFQEPLIDIRRGLVAPQNLMTETEQRRHPILTGLGQFGEGLTTPENLALIAGTMGIGELPATARAALSGYFAAQTAKGVVDYGTKGWEAYKRGDNSEAKRLWTLAAANSALAGFAGAHAIRESGLGPKVGLEPVVPHGTISAPLAMDEALARGGRHLQEFEANEAARQGMGRLAEAERGIAADRDARINAPVNLPRTYEGPTPVLSGRPAGPERNPLEVEAERVREEHAESRKPSFQVFDLRRVVPEDRSQPQYYEIAGQTETQPERRSGIAPPSAGESIGLRGRSATTGELAARVLPQIENSQVQRFGPDVLEDARQELNAAAGLASSFERPGRYFASIGQTEEPIPQRSQSTVKGIHYGGTWYGVSSARGMIEDMHPWFRDIAEGPETFSRIVQEGQGAAYDRLLERVATHIQDERETAQPVIDEFAPKLQSLALHVHDVDPELAHTLNELSSGRAVGFQNLREYIEGKIHDAETAAAFNRAIEDAAAEARNAAGFEEAPQSAGEARFERGGAEASRESAHPVDQSIDFQPTNSNEYADLTARTMGEHPRGLPVMRRGEFANSRGAEEARNVLASKDAERNIEEGLQGNRRDVAGEIREEHRTKLERGEIAPGTQPTEFYSGVPVPALMRGAQMLSRVWGDRVARPLIDRVLKIGDKYQKAREADPDVAEGLHLLDNAPQYLRAKATQEVHNVIGDLSREQERLFTLMADADSRENLRIKHHDEYAQAQRDPAIQAALRKYKPLEQRLTMLREKMGGQTLDQDYLRRVYEQHVAGINKRSAEERPAENGQFDRVIRPQTVNPYSREVSAEYHYQNGLHEFGPAFATKFIATHLKALRDEVAQDFLSKATLLQSGVDAPRSIDYGGQRYFRPDVAREMRDAGAKNAREYSYYNPTAGEKFPEPAEGQYLGPKELVKALTDYGRKEESEPGSLRRFFQEQILGFGFGVPHVFNILRRVTQQSTGGAANPKAWVDAFNVAFSKELRERGILGLNDPTFDNLAQHGAISTGEMANLKEYIGGNLNPANWARGLAQIGHKALFEPESFGGFGGLDQRARLYVADLMRSQRPELSDAQISRAVNDALGEYSRANWTDRQRLLGRFMMFPGWDFSSLRWVLQHPIRTTVPPALVVLLANRALHSFGQNREEDQYDISAIHVGDRAIGTGLLRESMARNLFRPALNYAQAKIRGESDRRALDEASRGAISGAGGVLGLMRPDLSGFVALATNRQNLFGGKELVGKQDWNAPGKILPSKALEKIAAFTVRHALPALDRMLDSNEDVDLRSFVGGNLGFPNYRDDAEKRLFRDTAEAEQVYQRVSKLAKTNPEQARQFLRDPDNATYALFYRDLAGMTKTLNRIDQAKEAVEGGKLSDAEKQSRLHAIEKARENVLAHADGLSRILFEKRQKLTGSSPEAGLLPFGLFGSQSQSREATAGRPQ